MSKYQLWTTSTGCGYYEECAGGAFDIVEGDETDVLWEGDHVTLPVQTFFEELGFNISRIERCELAIFDEEGGLDEVYEL